MPRFIKAVEGLHCSGGGVGVTIEYADLLDLDEPIIVRNCTFSSLENGLQVLGQQLSSRRPWPCRAILLRDNQISDCFRGILLSGRVNDVDVVGNRLWSCGKSCIILDDLFPGSGRIRILNNSLKNAGPCVLITDGSGEIRDLHIANNVLLAERGLDMLVTGKEPKVPSTWRVHDNWRQVRRPSPDSPEAKEWLDSDRDKVIDKLPLVSADPKSAKFLHPEADSPLAGEGAGKHDPTLPAYIGALPPTSVAAWDWEKTWRSRTGKN